MDKKIQNVLKFLNDLELLKSVLRHSWLSSGRQESVPEHSWRMALMAMVFKDEFPELDVAHVIELCLVHDLGEVYDGDIPAFLKQGDESIKEQQAVKKLVTSLSPPIQDKIIALWNEYTEAKTPESKLAKALDKLEVLLQHNEADIKTWSPEEYEFNFTYARDSTDYHEFTKKFRQAIDTLNLEKMQAAK